MCAPSHLISSHLRSSYHIPYLRICITSAHLHISDFYLRSLHLHFHLQVFIFWDHILSSHVRIFIVESHCPYLIIFKISPWNYYCNFTTWYFYVFKTSSPRSRANRRLVSWSCSLACGEWMYVTTYHHSTIESPLSVFFWARVWAPCRRGAWFPWEVAPGFRCVYMVLIFFTCIMGFAPIKRTCAVSCVV